MVGVPKDPAGPLTASKVAAANELYARSNTWRFVDGALTELRTRMPGFDPASVLIKAMAINQTYSTNVYALPAAARHIAEVLAKTDIGVAGPDLVEELAAVPTAGKQRMLRSFASKFANVFIDSERFPILDSVADETLRWHLGRSEIPGPKLAPYVAFVARIEALERASGLHVPRVQLDRYLWLAGLRRRWCADRSARINGEARRLFEADAAEGGTLGRMIWGPAGP